MNRRSSAKRPVSLQRESHRSVASAKKQKASQSAPAKSPAKEAEPVLSGRLVLALALLLAMSIIPVSGLGRLITKEAPETTARSSWKVGETANIHLTVVTSDYGDLACADLRNFNGNHCEFRNERERFTPAENAPVDDNKRNTLQPYRTTDQNLILAAGLWAQPEVAMRVHEEPASGTSKRKLARFVVACDVKFVDEWEDPQIRWSPGENWSTQGKAMVTELQACRVLKKP